MVYALDIGTKFTPSKLSTIGQLMNIVLPLMMTGAALIFLVMLLYGVFNIIRSGDNPEAIKKAYATVLWAVVGLFVVIASFVGVRLLGTLLGIPNIIQ